MSIRQQVSLDINMLLDIKDRYEKEASYLERVIDFLSSPEKDKIPFLKVYDDKNISVINNALEFSDRVLVSGLIESIADNYFYLPYDDGIVYIYFYHITASGVVIYSDIHNIGCFNLYGTLKSTWFKDPYHLHAKDIPIKMINKINKQLESFMDIKQHGSGINREQHIKRGKELKSLIENHNNIIKEELNRIKYGF